eukprot:TRINITY_DN3751_c0_g1_i1.p1 TRINITY_DN3751_c0_g1~~TRINITY_DN3751_c0_g1_i1.p1  ORF type:complete len:142 (+),score=13.38 TRINITY_DN3751_c0_g1_i1:498-923(+)
MEGTSQVCIAKHCHTYTYTHTHSLSFSLFRFLTLTPPSHRYLCDNRELVKTVAEPPRVQRYKTTAGVAYGREKANLGNTLLQHNMGRTQGAPSYTQDQPVTVYTSRKGHYGSAQTGRNPFAKNTRFSAPIDEFVEADAKDL